MSHLGYLAILAGCLLCVAPLAWIVRREVFGRPSRLGLTLLVTFVVFAAWDVWAIHAGHWWFARATTTGLRLPGRLPIEEALFFLVIPVCIILTFETVRRLLSSPASRHDRVDDVS